MLTSDVIEYAVLYVDLADVYFDLGMHEAALPIYLELSEHEEVSYWSCAFACTSLTPSAVDKQRLHPPSNRCLPQKPLKF